MECDGCRHRFSFGETFKILNPWNFPCPSCNVRLRYGPKGRLVLAIAGVTGVGLAGYFVFLWQLASASFVQSLGWTALAYALVLQPVQLLTLFVGDTRKR